MTDPAVAQAFTHLDSTIVLSRERAARGLYPTADPVASDSQMLVASRLGERHCDVARRVKQTIESYRQLEEIIFCWARRSCGRRTSGPPTGLVASRGS
jgi:F-type H+/Na+-transporting ATPase subunit beta